MNIKIIRNDSPLSDKEIAEKIKETLTGLAKYFGGKDSSFGSIKSCGQQYSADKRTPTVEYIVTE